MMGRSLLSLLPGPFRVDVFNRIVKTKMSVRQAEAMAARLLEEPKRIEEIRKNMGDTDIFAFEQEMQETLGTKVEVRYGRNPAKGRLVIHYHSIEQLNNIADRLKHKML